MSSALFYLAVAVGLAVLGSLLVVAYHRFTSGGTADGIEEFRRRMDTLSPDRPDPRPAPQRTSIPPESGEAPVDESDRFEDGYHDDLGPGEGAGDSSDGGDR